MRRYKRGQALSEAAAINDPAFFDSLNITSQAMINVARANVSLVGNWTEFLKAVNPLLAKPIGMITLKSKRTDIKKAAAAYKTKKATESVLVPAPNNSKDHQSESQRELLLLPDWKLDPQTMDFVWANDERTRTPNVPLQDPLPLGWSAVLVSTKPLSVQYKSRNGRVTTALPQSSDDSQIIAHILYGASKLYLVRHIAEDGESVAVTSDKTGSTVLGQQKSTKLKWLHSLQTPVVLVRRFQEALQKQTHEDPEWVPILGTLRTELDDIVRSFAIPPSPYHKLDKGSCCEPCQQNWTLYVKERDKACPIVNCFDKFGLGGGLKAAHMKQKHQPTEDRFLVVVATGEVVKNTDDIRDRPTLQLPLSQAEARILGISSLGPPSSSPCWKCGKQVSFEKLKEHFADSPGCQPCNGATPCPCCSAAGLAASACEYSSLDTIPDTASYDQALKQFARRPSRKINPAPAAAAATASSSARLDITIPTSLTTLPLSRSLESASLQTSRGHDSDFEEGNEQKQVLAPVSSSKGNGKRKAQDDPNPNPDLNLESQSTSKKSKKKKARLGTAEREARGLPQKKSKTRGTHNFASLQQNWLNYRFAKPVAFQNPIMGAFINTLSRRINASLMPLPGSENKTRTEWELENRLTVEKAFASDNVPTNYDLTYLGLKRPGNKGHYSYVAARSAIADFCLEHGLLWSKMLRFSTNYRIPFHSLLHNEAHRVLHDANCFAELPDDIQRPGPDPAQQKPRDVAIASKSKPEPETEPESGPESEPDHDAAFRKIQRPCPGPDPAQQKPKDVVIASKSKPEAEPEPEPEHEPEPEPDHVAAFEQDGAGRMILRCMAVAMRESSTELPQPERLLREAENRIVAQRYMSAWPPGTFANQDNPVNIVRLNRKGTDPCGLNVSDRIDQGDSDANEQLAALINLTDIYPEDSVRIRIEWIWRGPDGFTAAGDFYDTFVGHYTDPNTYNYLFDIMVYQGDWGPEIVQEPFFVQDMVYSMRMHGLFSRARIPNPGLQQRLVVNSAAHRLFKLTVMLGQEKQSNLGRDNEERWVDNIGRNAI